jgi:hypothetical protein
VMIIASKMRLSCPWHVLYDQHACHCIMCMHTLPCCSSHRSWTTGTPSMHSIGRRAVNNIHASNFKRVACVASHHLISHTACWCVLQELDYRDPLHAQYWETCCKQHSCFQFQTDGMCGITSSNFTHCLLVCLTGAGLQGPPPCTVLGGSASAGGHRAQGRPRT